MDLKQVGNRLAGTDVVFFGDAAECLSSEDLRLGLRGTRSQFETEFYGALDRLLHTICRVHFDEKPMEAWFETDGWHIDDQLDTFPRIEWSLAFQGDVYPSARPRFCRT